MKRAVLAAGVALFLLAALAAPAEARRPELCPDRSRVGCKQPLSIEKRRSEGADVGVAGR